MKKLLMVGFAVISLALYACGGDDKSAANPNDAAKEFSNPTGKITSANAKAVANASLKAKNASGVTSTGFQALKKESSTLDPKFFPNALTQSEIEACTDTSGSSTTINWECLAPKIETGCTGSGTTVSTSNQGDDFYTYEYNDWSLNCTGDAQFDFTCNGSTSVSTTNVGVSCSDLTCEYTDFTFDFNGCINANGDYLIRVDGDSYVLEEISTDGTCTNVTMTITDSSGSNVITCTAGDTAQSCSTLDDVQTVTSCTVN